MCVCVCVEGTECAHVRFAARRRCWGEAAGRWALHTHLLPRALRDDDDAVALLREARLDVAEEPRLARELEGDLRHEAHVHAARGDGRVRRDEARVAPHQRDDADAVGIGDRLVARHVDGARRLLHRRTCQRQRHAA